MKKAITILFVCLIMIFCSFGAKAEMSLEEQKKNWAKDFDKIVEDSSRTDSDFDNRFCSRHWRFFEFLFLFISFGGGTTVVTTTFLDKSGAYQGTASSNIPVEIVAPGGIIIFFIAIYYLWLRSAGLGLIFGMIGLYFALFCDFLVYIIDKAIF